MSQPCLDELLFSMKAIVRRNIGNFAGDFAKSILRQSKRADWTPTPKQLALMRRLVFEHYTGGAQSDDLDVIEREERQRA